MFVEPVQHGGVIAAAGRLPEGAAHALPGKGYPLAWQMKSSPNSPLPQRDFRKRPLGSRSGPHPPTAKGITSGYLPLGATLVSDEIAEAVIRTVLAHGFTYSGHPTTTAVAALANLELLGREDLIPRVRDDIGPYFQSKLRRFIVRPSAKCKMD